MTIASTTAPARIATATPETSAPIAAAMATRLEVSNTTIRHWMGRYGLSTSRGRRLADTAGPRAAGLTEAQGTCPTHGDVTLIRRGTDGFSACRPRRVASA